MAHVLITIMIFVFGNVVDAFAATMTPPSIVPTLNSSIPPANGLASSPSVPMDPSVGAPLQDSPQMVAGGAMSSSTMGMPNQQMIPGAMLSQPQLQAQPIVQGLPGTPNVQVPSGQQLVMLVPQGQSPVNTPPKKKKKKKRKLKKHLQNPANSPVAPPQSMLPPQQPMDQGQGQPNQAPLPSAVNPSVVPPQPPMGLPQQPMDQGQGQPNQPPLPSAVNPSPVSPQPPMGTPNQAPLVPQAPMVFDSTPAQIALGYYRDLAINKNQLQPDTLLTINDELIKFAEGLKPNDSITVLKERIGAAKHIYSFAADEAHKQRAVKVLNAYIAQPNLPADVVLSTLSFIVKHARLSENSLKSLLHYLIREQKRYLTLGEQIKQSQLWKWSNFILNEIYSKQPDIKSNLEIFYQEKMKDNTPE